MIPKKQQELAEGAGSPPRHIAIIMDGNGRWAKKRGLPRTAGHAAGVESFRRAAKYCRRIGVEYLTVYAFSTENWKRPMEEVQAIMGLLKKYLGEALEGLAAEQTRLCFFGDLTALSPELQALCLDCAEKSKNYQGGQVNICLNYGGRDEIIRAAKKWAAEGCPELTEERFGGYLWSAGVPDPDLLIRPGGEMRISNYLLWQMAYTEMVFSDVLWPDFDEREIDKAIEIYHSRNRRYGDVKQEE
ncbi:MAG: di-trans,poly-cis-decaprenylcistransferase [Oscillospiraceae bacterium]|nr:di-trans,poly-cis-decaprenylcistransferase [Oscillospiraceae bacterium]